MTGPRLVLAALTAVIVASCGLPSTSQPTALSSPGELIWPAPSNALELAVKAGLTPETKERLLFHVHAHLDVFVDGSPVLVPAGIGINVLDPGVHHGVWNDNPTYGGIAECAQPCISPLHTHDVSGTLHTESAFNTTNKLGQFFTEWGITLSDSCVDRYCAPATPIAVYVDGKRFSGKMADIPLSGGTEIAVVIGSSPKAIPSTFPK